MHLRIILVGNQLDAQFLLWYVYLNPLHVSSGIPLIIRSSKMYFQPVVYIPIWWRAVVQAGWTMAGHHMCIYTRGCKYILELLMMSGMPLETRWAFNKLWNNKFCYNVACCWLFLLIHYDASSRCCARCWICPNKTRGWWFGFSDWKNDNLMKFIGWCVLSMVNMHVKYNSGGLALYVWNGQAGNSRHVKMRTGSHCN